MEFEKNNPKFFQCYKCFYQTKKKNNIIFHFNRKNKCIKNDKCYYTDIDIKLLNEKQLSNNDNTNDNNDQNNVIKNEYINCKYCNRQYKYKFNMNKHIKNYHKEDKEEESIVFKNINIINNNVNNVNNISNINNINITNIILDTSKLVPFDEDWDLSKISNDKKHLLLFSKIMYTTLLEEILKNEINLNVIMDKEGKSGLVYTNNECEEKYINMEYEKIIEKSMEKLNKNLNDIYKDIENKNYNYLDDCKFDINDKFQKFIESKSTQETVSKYLINIYENKKEDAIKIMNEMKLESTKDIGY